MKYFHRTHCRPTTCSRARRPSSAPGSRRSRSSRAGAGSPAPSARSGSTVQAEGGHYTLVTVETNQVGESEADKLAKRFLTVVHTMADPTHRPIGAY